jgi:LPXTG-motif cell wall-anchored protein
MKRTAFEKPDRFKKITYPWHYFKTCQVYGHIIATVSAALLLLWGLGAILAAGAAPAASLPLAQTTPAIPYPDQRDAVTQAVAWLVNTHQNDDGGYTSFSAGANAAPSDVAGAVDAVLAIAGAGYNPAAPAPGAENTPIGYLRQHAADVAAYAATDGATAGKLILALAAANQDPRAFGNADVTHNFVVSLTNHLSPTGQYNVTNAFGQSLALLALGAVHEPAPPPAVAWLQSLQANGGQIDGSWDDGFGVAGNADATALAVMALVAGGVPATDSSLARALDFLRRSQLESGGWAYGPDFAENANSTALVVQALRALGQDFFSASSPWAKNDATPLTALLAWQSQAGAFQADFGSGRADDFFTTAQAIAAAAGKAYPLPGRYEAARQAVACLVTLQDPATGGWEQFATFGVDAAGTSRAIQAIAAIGADPEAEQFTVNGLTAPRALANLTPAHLAAGRGGGVGIIMQGVVAAGADVHDFAGADLVISVTQYLSPTGEYDNTAFGPYAHAEAMLGLLAAGEDVAEPAVNFLLNSHNNGDWGGPDSNGIALNVLGKVGLAPPEAIANLRATQLADGGWGFDASSPNSSSEVVQGLVSAGENPFGPQWSQVVSGTISSAAGAILAQQGENGCWPNLFGPGDDPFATTDAVLLLAQQPPWPAAAEITQAATAMPTTAATGAPTATAAATATPAPTDTAEPTMAPVAATETPVMTAQPTATPAPAPPETGDRNTLNLVLAAVLVLAIAAGAFWYFRSR